VDLAAALLLPLVGGFFFVNHCFLTRYSSARDEGHRLYFRAAFAGAFLLVFSLLSLLLARELLGDWLWFIRTEQSAIKLLGPLMKDQAQAKAHLGLAVACILAMLLGPGLAGLINFGFGNWYRERFLWSAVLKDEGETFLLDAVSLERTIMVSLSSGKIYVGYVLSTLDPTIDRKWLTLLPFMSGHRREDGTVHFTTSYDQVYQGMEADFQDDFHLVLPLDKVTSMSFFDPDAYKRFSLPNEVARQSKDLDGEVLLDEATGQLSARGDSVPGPIGDSASDGLGGIRSPL
jgi:hypothetical protein